MSQAGNDYLESAKKQFAYYRMLGEKALAQLPDVALFWHSNEDSNSMAVIVRHLSGNMVSRWTDFLTTDGEKSDRNRDGEFETTATTRAEVMEVWGMGWQVFEKTMNALTSADLERIIYIRNQGHTVTEAINRQLAHYPYHIGQMVYIAKMAADRWETLSIPRNASKSYNQAKFESEKKRAHFTDEFLPKDEKKPD